MDSRMTLALEFMQAHRAEHPAVSLVAAQVGLSRSRFEHLLKQEAGESFTLCLRRLRLEKAKCLLADPRLRVKEVAAQCGYFTTRSFARDFKRYLRLPPREWRRQHI